MARIAILSSGLCAFAWTMYSQNMSIPYSVFKGFKLRGYGLHRSYYRHGPPNASASIHLAFCRAFLRQKTGGNSSTSHRHPAAGDRCGAVILREENGCRKSPQGAFVALPGLDHRPAIFVSRNAKIYITINSILEHMSEIVLQVPDDALLALKKTSRRRQFLPEVICNTSQDAQPRCGALRRHGQGNVSSDTFTPQKTILRD